MGCELVQSPDRRRLMPRCHTIDEGLGIIGEGRDPLAALTVRILNHHAIDCLEWCCGGIVTKAFPLFKLTSVRKQPPTTRRF